MIWAVPSPRDRLLVVDPTNRRHRRFAAAVASLDWLARFRTADAPAGSPLTVVDRDGRIVERGAGRFAASRLPLTAWFALPALLLPAVRRARRAS